LRGAVPRSSHSALELPADRDPVSTLAAQNGNRLPELVPIRIERMSASPLAFFRGAAAVMTRDLAATPTTDLRVQLSGDAHLLNFGGFASPERALVFDLNDFDETLPGPFEWDVKRLAASLEVACRERGFNRAHRSAAVVGAVRTYREAMRGFSAMGDLDVWYARLDARSILRTLRAEHDSKRVKVLRRSSARARDNDSRRALRSLTRRVDGEPRITAKPPLIVPMAELDADGETGALRGILESYVQRIQPDRRVLLRRFRYADAARKVVGIGSVGTRCWIVLMLGRDDHDPLILQLKEAQPSVLEALLGPSDAASHGQRVVDGQRLMQAASDIFLGWAQTDSGFESSPRDFYVRQLRDWKISLDVETISPRGLLYYAIACGWTLARAHARSGDRFAIAGYLGSSDRFDRAVATYAAAYADVNEADHHAFVRAIADGRLDSV
jgi:uncharacterized protein (DUF2252 family)